MGNAASNTSDPESPEKSEGSDAGSDSPRCLEEKCGGQPCATSPKVTLDKDVLCKNLRERGLCIAESDLEDVLAKHSNLVEALTHVIDSGLARRKAKVPRGKGVPKRKKHHENVCPVPPSSPQTASKATGKKRARQGEDNVSPRQQQQQQQQEQKQQKQQQQQQQQGEEEQQQRTTVSTSRSERPLKRTACMKYGSMDIDAASDTVFTKAFDATGLAPYIASADVSELVDGMTSEDQSADAHEMQARVLVPVQPGSSPKPLASNGATSETQLKIGSEENSSPQDVLEVVIERTLEPLPEKLNMGDMSRTMTSGVVGWANKTPEEKKEAARAVMKDLRLPWVGLERQERLKGSLLRCIRAAMEDLAKMSNVENDAVMAANMVRETRETIHKVTVAVGGKYRSLYGQSSQVTGDGSREPGSRTEVGSGGRQAVLVGSPESSGQQQQQQQQRIFTSHFYSRSPSRDSRSSGDSQSVPSTGHAFGRTLGAKERERGGMGLVGRSPSSFFSKTQGRQPSPTSVSVGFLGSGGGGSGGKGDKASELDAEAAARAHFSPEEAMFWTSCNICKASLKMTTFARKEGEWLDQQEKRVVEQEAQTKSDSMEYLQQHEDVVAKLEEQLRGASETIEASTRDVIGAHVSPQASTEDALRSLLATLQQGQNQSAIDQLEMRKRALSLHNSLLVTLKTQRARLLLVKHASAITSILCEELFGDLLDTISGMRRQANERWISNQDNLKSTANHVLGKLKVAMKFHFTRKRTAEITVESEHVNLEQTCRLFGNDGLAATGIKARIHEMKVFAADSADKMRQIKRQAGKLYSKMEADLPEEEFSSLSEEIKAFFSAEADLVSAEVGGGNPGRLGMSSGQGMSGVEEDVDDCTVM